ncbi:MAG: hypothetical protein FRX49_09165 [Trebouxia sp. A1-2]|nr:MAG: hypothetical protein FRX49_09165 [Trebouxia sp. A1-2]
MPRPVPVPGGIDSPNGITGILRNGPCVAGFVAFFIAQSLKVLTHWYTEAKWDFTQVMRSGGMPSSHTACVVGLTAALGTIQGTDTGTFAIGLVLSLVATVLNIIISQLPADHPGSGEIPLRDRLGHTPRQVAVGALLGVVTGYLVGITWHGFGMPS